VLSQLGLGASDAGNGDTAWAFIWQ
jgi:hypothetical protein